MITYLRNIEFVDPWFLWLVILPMAWYLWRFIKKKNSDTTFTISSSEPVEGSSSFRSKLIWLPDVLRLIGLIFLTLAIARPQLTLKEEEVKAEGIDIMLAMARSICAAPPSPLSASRPNEAIGGGVTQLSVRSNTAPAADRFTHGGSVATPCRRASCTNEWGE